MDLKLKDNKSSEVRCIEDWNSNLRAHNRGWLRHFSLLLKTCRRGHRKTRKTHVQRHHMLCRRKIHTRKARVESALRKWSCHKNKQSLFPSMGLCVPHQQRIPIQRSSLHWRHSKRRRWRSNPEPLPLPRRRLLHLRPMLKRAERKRIRLAGVESPDCHRLYWKSQEAG